jgi:hypothetical protein
MNCIELFIQSRNFHLLKLVEHFKNEYLTDVENPLTEDEAEVDAMEWVDYNIAGGYLGVGTPLIISME